MSKFFLWSFTSCCTSFNARAVDELLGKNMSVLAPSQEESDTFAARRGRQEFFPGMALLPDYKKQKREKQNARERPHTAEDERKFPRESRNHESLKSFHNFLPLQSNFMLFCVSQEESVFRTDISKNSCRSLLLTFDSLEVRFEEMQITRSHCDPSEPPAASTASFLLGGYLGCLCGVIK